MQGRSLVPVLPLWREGAEKALRIFKRLRVPDIPGTPTLAEACGEWFFPIVEAVFGSLDPETKTRMIQEFFLLIPKGNSKTSYGGALMVVALIVNHRPEGEFHLIAPTKQIADLAFKQASGTIRLDEPLNKIFQIQTHVRTITHRRTGATLQIKAADTDVITGGKQVGTMIDETHEFAKRANAENIFVEIRGALGKRPDGFLIQTTTQSKDPPHGVFARELKTARQVRDGIVKLPVLPILYEFPDEVIRSEGWRDEKLWPLVNPNLGRSLQKNFLVNELMKADSEGAAKVALIASQHFNVEIGIGLRTDRWTGADCWLENTDETLTLETLIERSEVVTVGIDGGGLDDLLGLAVVGREKGTRRRLLWVHAWCHPKVLQIRQEIASTLLDFERDGDLTIIKESDQDVEEVASLVLRLDDEGLLPETGAVGVDPVGIQEIIDALSARDFDVSKETGRVVAVPQNWTLNNTILSSARHLQSGAMIHADQPLMTWCVGNAKIEPRGNSVTVTKQVSGKAKIDPMMAMLNAVALMTQNPEAGNIYEDDRELRFA